MAQDCSDLGGNIYPNDNDGGFADAGVESVGDPDVGKASWRRLPPPRQLACKRCHGQKLRCIRSRPMRYGPACDRCIAANVACIDRRPRRLGRPLQNDAIDSAHLRRRPDEGQVPGQEALIVPPATALQVRPEGQNRTAASPGLQQEPPPMLGSCGNSAMLAPLAGPSFPRWPWPDVFSAGSLCPDDAVDPPAAEQDQVDKAVANDGDPLEHLSGLHMDLYHCLTSIRKVEKFKRGILESRPDPIDPDVDFNWPEKLFRTTESFISSLDSYTEKASAEDGGATLSEGPPATEGQEASPAPGDAATGLMILGCYTRLLQIFEIMVFVVESFRDLDCPGSVVQVRIGSFAPRADRDLHARVLGQYVLHLLHGITGAVDRAVATRQPYARAVADLRGGEARLKERIHEALMMRG